eukprot:SAG31_NODE_5836_length_2303_cov_1.138838_2_plen_224_part_00
MFGLFAGCPSTEALPKAAVNGSGFVGPFATIPLLSSFRLPPVQVIQTNPVVSSWSSADRSEIFDFGVNSAALVELRVAAASCPLTLRIQFAEAIHKNGSLYHHITGVSTEVSTFTCMAAQQNHTNVDMLTYRSHWTQMGYRYAEVTQVAGVNLNLSMLDIASHSVSTGFDTRKESAFECSHNLTNAIHNATRNTARSNFMSFPTDCPQRERVSVLALFYDKNY